MRTLKLVLLFVITLFIFQGKIFATITSRIEGVIINHDTKKAINGAEVRLYRYSESERALTYTKFIYLIPGKGIKPGTRYSDKGGRFRFDDVTKGQFFLAVFKEGYGTYGPLLSTMETSKSINKKEMGKVDVFFVKEGEIKHMIIKLKKEAVLKIILKMKIPQGIIPYPEYYFKFKHSSYWQKLNGSVNSSSRYRNNISQFLVTEDSIRSVGIDEGIVDLDIMPFGFPDFSVTGIVLNSGQVKILERILDFTKGQVIHGAIKGKDTGEPLYFVDVDLYKNENEVVSTRTNKQGEFWIGGIEPGTYKIVFYRFYAGIEISHKEIITIAPDEKIQLNKSF